MKLSPQTPPGSSACPRAAILLFLLLRATFPTLALALLARGGRGGGCAVSPRELLVPRVGGALSVSRSGIVIGGGVHDRLKPRERRHEL